MEATVRKEMMKHYINRRFNKSLWQKSLELTDEVASQYTWPDLCEGQRAYIYEGEDSSQLYMTGKDDMEYICLYCWTEAEN